MVEQIQMWFRIGVQLAVNQWVISSSLISGALQSQCMKDKGHYSNTTTSRAIASASKSKCLLANIYPFLISLGEIHLFEDEKSLSFRIRFSSSSTSNSLSSISSVRMCFIVSRVFFTNIRCPNL